MSHVNEIVLGCSIGVMAELWIICSLAVAECVRASRMARSNIACLRGRFDDQRAF